MHIYDDKFFDWVDSGARRSARALLPLVQGVASPSSVVDIGCGRGTWLAVWSELGVEDVVGVDGDYVDRKRLNISPERFVPRDITGDLALNRRFDLAQSLEVAEHIDPKFSRAFVDGLCALSDIVVFSAAQPGQGGEMHVNEQTPEFWAQLFAEKGYDRYDCLRHKVARDSSIEPWYRFNVFLFANASGKMRLQSVAGTELPAQIKAPEFGGVVWKLRKLVLKRFSVETVTALSRLNYKMMTVVRSVKSAF